MSDEVTVEVEGLPELLTQLNDLVKHLNPSEVEPILMDRGKELYQAVKDKAPVKSGNLKRNIKIKQLDRIGSNPKSVLVRSYAKHSQIVEFGTKPRRQKNGRYTGSMPATPFFRPAVDSRKERVIEEIVQDLENKIDEVVT